VSVYDMALLMLAQGWVVVCVPGTDAEGEPRVWVQGSPVVRRPGIPPPATWSALEHAGFTIGLVLAARENARRIGGMVLA
jgi:hypothetical protein